MNKFIEEENILTFRKKSFDVSNVSVERLEKAEIIWNREILRDGFTIKSVNKMSENVGLYLIRQDFSVLLFRMTFMKAVKSYISRYLLTIGKFILQFIFRPFFESLIISSSVY